MRVSKRTTSLALASIIGCWALATTARGQQEQTVQIVNRASNAMVALRVKPTGVDGWSPDLLKGEPLLPGTYRNVQVPGDMGCFFDFGRIYEDRAQRVSEHVNVCGAGPTPVNLTED